MLSENELQALRELDAKATGELRFWPTHYMGTTPYIFAVAEDGRETQLFIARNAKGKTADTELSGYEGDRAIAYAKRMTAATNALPNILAHMDEKAKRIAELEAALAPFAAVAEEMDRKRGYENIYGVVSERGEVNVVVADFRKARRVLRKEGNA
jgi:hypothetical protein